jgi:hypothetical protein
VQNLEDAFQRLSSLVREAQLEAMPKAAPKERVVPDHVKLARIQAKKANSKAKADRSRKDDY